MLCEKCGIREANISFTEIRNGVKTEHHFCAQCARELNFGPVSALIEGDFPLGKILTGLLGLPSSSEEDQELAEVSCPTCGTTYQEFVQNSCFGCADCYHVFDMLIGEKIKKLQDNDTHKGKVPKMRAGVRAESRMDKQGDLEFSPEERIRQLKRRVEEAIRSEDYEQAAACRDKIRAIEKEAAAGADAARRLPGKGDGGGSEAPGTGRSGPEGGAVQ